MAQLSVERLLSVYLEFSLNDSVSTMWKTMSTKVGNVRFLWPIQITQSIIYKQQDVKMIYADQPHDILNPYLLSMSEVKFRICKM